MKKVFVFLIILVLSHLLILSDIEYRYNCEVNVHFLTASDYLREILKGSLDSTIDKLKVLNDDIVNGLKKAFNDVWVAFENNQGSIKDAAIRDAIEKLRKRVLCDDLLNSDIYYVNFCLDEFFFECFKVKELKSSTLRSKIVHNCMDVHAGSNLKNEIDIFNGVGDFKYDNFKTVDPLTGCEHKYVLENYKVAQIKKEKEFVLPLWSDEADNVYSFKSVLFHELVHIALKDAGIDRYIDDASVEDITLQLFPRPDGFNLYEMLYDYGLFVNDLRHYPDDGRKFNPRIEFNGKKLYYYPSEEIGTIGNGVKVQGLSCDDAISSSYKKMVVPYIKCCKTDGCVPGQLLAMGSSMWINDVPDDNYSFAEGIVKEYNLDPEAVIFTRGHWEDALKLFGGLQFDGNNTAEMLLEATPYLIFPTGSLAPMQDSAIFKNLIEQYVSLGGVIIIFASQYGSEVEKLIPRPAGEKLKVYGWRDDSSCLRASVYYTSMPPVVSSSTIDI